jgi:rhodanese-related sulfurtransferase
MHAMRFVHILGLALALAAYSAWALGRSGSRTTVGAKDYLPLPGRVPLIDTDQAHDLWRDPGTLFVDVRPLADYEFGHIAGAIHFPEPDFDKVWPALRDQLTRARTIVVYCKSPDCGLSYWAAIRLHNEGLTQTQIYTEGWNDWVTHGLPVSRIRE